LTGTAITIVAPADQKAVGAIEKLIGQSIAWAGELPRESAEPRGNGRRPREAQRSKAPAREQRHATPSVPRVNEARRPGVPEHAPAGGTDNSHLPAFLLRPIRAKA
jgi:hypothetical protein